ncbi:helicase [Streptomyces sp. NBC_01318]|nr:helicase [Streptomyces sp. NBC_01318]
MFLSSQKGRRHRLTDQQLAALANLGLEWAA